MKMKVFIDSNFFTSFNRLMMQDNIPIRIGYQLASIKEVFLSEHKKFEDIRLGLIEQLSEKDEKGQIKRNPDGTAVFAPENGEIWNKKYAELQDIDFTLPAKVKLADIEVAKMKPQDLLNIKEILEA